MDSFPVITIDLVLDRLTTRDVLKAVLHSILFHRLFGTIKPQSLEILDVTMPGVKDTQIEILIDEKVDLFWKAVENGTNKRGQITVTFSEKRKKTSWFSVGEEEVPWERWVINAEVKQPRSEADRQTFNTTLSSTLTKTLQIILTHTASEKGRSAVPLITNNSGISPFPFKIQHTSSGAASTSPRQAIVTHNTWNVPRYAYTKEPAKTKGGHRAFGGLRI